MRIRTTKPEFWRSDDITALRRETRLLFIGLWSYVDDNGVGVDDHRQIAADLFALEEDQKETRDYVREGLDALSRALLVIRYKIDGKPYLFIRTWDRHQKIDRPGKPRLPRPPDDWKPPTCEDSPPGTDSDTDSREPLETIPTVSPRARVLGTGEQRNRGTEEQTTKSTRSSVNAATAASPSGTPKKPRASRAEREPEGFADFWSAYPRKVAKRAARASYTAALTRGAEPAELLSAARRYALAVQASEPRFVAHPPTWLNQGRYEDEPDQPLSRRPEMSDDPDTAFADLRARADTLSAARLIGAVWFEPAQPPSDPTPHREWQHAQRLAWIDRHADQIRDALAQRQAS